MKRIIPALALSAIALQPLHVSAQPPERKRGADAPRQRGPSGFGQRGPNGFGQRGQNGFGQRGARENARGTGGMPGGGFMNLDPTLVAKRMMSQFDKDGDDKLDQTELLAMLTTLREQRGVGAQSGNDTDRDSMKRGRGRMQGDREGGQRPTRKRRPQNDNDDAEPGGTKPQRPTEE